MSSQPQRRLSARRGSVSASDPFGQHTSLNHDSNRSSSSTLTIVRVLDSGSHTGASTCTGINQSILSDHPTPVLSRRSSRHPGGVTSSTIVDAPAGRLSFAFSTFASNSTSNSSPVSTPAITTTAPARRATSPSTSPRLRSSSPSQFNRRQSSSGSSPFSKTILSPEQLLELARQSTSPRYVPPPASRPATPHSPVPPSPGGSAGPVAGMMTAPATFTPLPADIYLPFVDRAIEVTQLLSTPPTARLFSLLAQTLPKEQGPETPIDPAFSTDPTKWTFGTLRLWLTTVDRQAVDDALWVRNARKCVLSHSELIWERLKGALGVPPELEIDGDDESALEMDDCSLRGPTTPIPGNVFEDSDTPHVSSPVVDEPTQYDSTPSSSPLVPSSSPTHVSIEPIVATPASNTNISTTSSGQGDGLQDIGEETEDEDGADTEMLEKETQPVEDSPQIHGLRISTSPVPSSPAVGPQSFSYPTSPYLNDSGRNSVDLRLPSEIFLPLTRKMSRTSSHGSVGSLGRPTFTSYSQGYHTAGSDFGDNDNERAYDPVGDRVPGNPLFPSNFARLALGPTLRANNPNLRSSRSPPPSAHPRFAKLTGGRPPSWIESWDPSKHEYAATIASSSSVGVGNGE